MQKFRELDLGFSRRRRYWKYETKCIEDIGKILPNRIISIYGDKYLVKDYDIIREEVFNISPNEVVFASNLKKKEYVIPVTSYGQVKDIIPRDVYELAKEIGAEIKAVHDGLEGTLVIGKSARKVYVVERAKLLKPEPKEVTIYIPEQDFEIIVPRNEKPYTVVGIEYKNADMVAYVPKVLYDLGIVTEEDLGISPWNARVYEEGDIAIVKQEGVGGLAGEDEYRKRLTWDDVREILKHIKKGEE